MHTIILIWLILFFRFFSLTACTDPGIVFVKPEELRNRQRMEILKYNADVEKGLGVPPLPPLTTGGGDHQGVGTNGNINANNNSNGSAEITTDRNIASDNSETSANHNLNNTTNNGHITHELSIVTVDTSSANLTLGTNTNDAEADISCVDKSNISVSVRSGRQPAGGGIGGVGDESSVNLNVNNHTTPSVKSQAQVAPTDSPNSSPQQASKPQHNRAGRSNSAGSMTSSNNPSSQRNSQINQLIECGSCAMKRPTSASHCYDCGLCIDEIDHHCPVSAMLSRVGFTLLFTWLCLLQWTGKCIAKKNIKTFYYFLWCLSAHIVFVLVITIYCILQGNDVFSTPSSK
jgi:hypothetical protein